jgi:hypothetical protein
MKNFIFSFVLLVTSLYPQSQFRFYINNINMPLDNKGVLADVSMPPEGSLGRYNDIGFLFSGGFWLSGYNGDTLWANAQATASRIINYIPGNVDSNQYDPRYQIYVIQKSDPPFGYEWQQWKFAVNLGAGFYDGDGDGEYYPIDLNNNGQWDPEEDRPDIIGEQIGWCVYNDGVIIRERFVGIPPLGIEIHQTVFGYYTYSAPQLKNVLFIRYKILNTGKVNSILDSVYFTAWADADLGDHVDDLVGCDTTINSGFTYNFGPDAQFGEDPPAFFINLLQGPYAYIPGETFIDINSNGIYDDGIDTPLDTAYNHQGPLKGIQIFPGARNQKMTAYTHYHSSDPVLGDPTYAIEARNYMLGRGKLGQILNPCTWVLGQVRGGVDCNLVNPFYWYSGDPESNYGWINILGTDQRMLVHTGPFSLEVGKPITIIAGYTIGHGNDPLNSVTAGKITSAFVQQFYQSNFDDNILGVENEGNQIVNEFQLYQNYPNPFNPTTKIKYTIPQSVILSEAKNLSQVSLKVFDILGNEIVVLVDEEKPVGNYEVTFDASELPSGVYFYRLQAGGFIQSKKMVLLK